MIIKRQKKKFATARRFRKLEPNLNVVFIEENLDLDTVFVICNRFWYSKYVRLPNGLRYLRVGGRGQCLGAEKSRSQKNACKSHRLPHVR